MSEGDGSRPFRSIGEGLRGWFGGTHARAGIFLQVVSEIRHVCVVRLRSEIPGRPRRRIRAPCI